VSIELI